MKRSRVFYPRGGPAAARHATLAAALLLAASARAEPVADERDTLSPFLYWQYGYDSNLFRLTDALPGATAGRRAETFWTLGAGMDAHLRHGRQTLLARAEINRSQFATYDALDFVGRDVLLRWDWVAGSRLGGRVGMSDSVTQASYANVRKPVSNVVRTQRGFIDGTARIDSRWQALFGLDTTRIDNDAAALRVQDATVDSARGGVTFETARGSTLAFTSRVSRGRSPNRQAVGNTAVANDYNQWDNGFELGWSPTAKTQLTGVLNYTTRSYDAIPARDFSGVTGHVGVEWDVSGKTTFKAQVHRVIGAGEGTTASHTINNGVSLDADWQATSKLALQTGVRFDRLTYAGDPVVPLAGATPRQDEITTLRAGAEYAVLRNTHLGMSLERGNRRSSDPLAGYDYKRALVTVRGQF